jgi:formylglycine-generating enzyme required for sulfatase activity
MPWWESWWKNPEPDKTSAIEAGWKHWQQEASEADQVALDAALEGLSQEPEHIGFSWALLALQGRAPKLRERFEPDIPWELLVEARGDLTKTGVRAGNNESGLLVRVEPGRFKMGCTAVEAIRLGVSSTACPPKDRAVYQAFYLGQTPVTQSQYQAITGKNPSFFQGRIHRPVESISWLDACHFCNLLSLREGLKPAYRFEVAWVEWDETSPGYRLPTEVEWEYAAKAGQETLFAGSDRIEEVGLVERSCTRPMPVREKGCNAWGLYDMSGNVWEWCWDRFSDRGTTRVIRGGSWSSKESLAAVVSREGADPERKESNIGFRIARWV